MRNRCIPLTFILHVESKLTDRAAFSILFHLTFISCFIIISFTWTAPGMTLTEDVEQVDTPPFIWEDTRPPEPSQTSKQTKDSTSNACAAWFAMLKRRI